MLLLAVPHFLLLAPCCLHLRPQNRPLATCFLLLAVPHFLLLAPCCLHVSGLQKGPLATCFLLLAVPHFLLLAPCCLHLSGLQSGPLATASAPCCSSLLASCSLLLAPLRPPKRTSRHLHFAPCCSHFLLLAPCCLHLSGLQKDLSPLASCSLPFLTSCFLLLAACTAQASKTDPSTQLWPRPAAGA